MDRSWSSDLFWSIFINIFINSGMGSWYESKFKTFWLDSFNLAGWTNGKSSGS